MGGIVLLASTFLPALALADESSSSAVDSEEVFEREPPAHPKDRQRGPWLRLTVELSRLVSTAAATARLERTGLEIARREERELQTLLGGMRLEAGYAFGRGGFAVIPKGHVAFGVGGPQVWQREVIGRTMDFQSEVSWWEAGYGAELQFFKRTMGFAADLGFSGAPATFRTVSPDDLSVEGQGHQLGFRARGALTLRLPHQGQWGGGLSLAAQASLGVDSWATRLTAGLFFEWDRGRSAQGEHGS